MLIMRINTKKKKNQLCFWKPGGEKKKAVLSKEKSNLFKAWLDIQENENTFNDEANLLAFY